MNRISTALLAAAFVLIGTSASAQVITDVNVGAGVFSSALSPVDYAGAPYTPQGGTGFQLNSTVLVRRDSSKNFGMQTGASISINTLESGSIGAARNAGPEWTIGYLDVPVMLFYEVASENSRVTFAAGTTFGLNLFTNSEFEKDGVADQLATFDLGYSGAIGLEHSLLGREVLWLASMSVGQVNLYTGEDAPDWFQDQIDVSGGVRRISVSLSCNVRL